MRNIKDLANIAKNKDKFLKVSDYTDFCLRFMEFLSDTDNYQAEIVANNLNQYHFIQYGKNANFKISRPINWNIFIHDCLEDKIKDFNYALKHIRETESIEQRDNLNNLVYTCQQCIGASLDALSANAARKINGDLFERFIRLILNDIGVCTTEGTENVKITIDDEYEVNIKYQHDLIINKNEEVRAIGSVKTSSKDRMDKIFLEKHAYNLLTGKELPHFAVFLNDVQRTTSNKKRTGSPSYNISTTFVTGHFKGYTVKLNPLDGVYYCDLISAMRTDTFLKKEIHTLDRLLVDDIWQFVKDKQFKTRIKYNR